MLRMGHLDTKEPVDSLDSCCILRGDTLVDKSSGDKIGVTVQRYPMKVDTGKRGRRDSIVLHFHWEDTLFRISADHILRKYRDHYLLNAQSDDSSWVVRSLDLRKNILILRNIPDSVALHFQGENGNGANPDSMGLGKRNDSAVIRLQATRKQFKKLVRQNGFAEEERFVRTGD
jgi:hypothetical protein